MFLNTCLLSLRWHELLLVFLSDYYGKIVLKIGRCFGGFGFVFASEELRQVNGEVFADCPCRKGSCTFNIFSQKPAVMISGSDFFHEYLNLSTRDNTFALFAALFTPLTIEVQEGYVIVIQIQIQFSAVLSTFLLSSV